MWLPKDERLLLALYFRKIGKPDEQETFKDNDDMKALGWEESKSNDDYDKQYTNRVWNADDILKKRGFLDVLNRDIGEKTISLTIRGHDLGRKYNSWWIRSRLWFAEYKHHWIWLIVSFLGGMIGALIINCLSKGS
ncbi:hypothetical protein ES707_12602 [subsurface metagenome]